MLGKEESKQLRVDFWSKLGNEMEKMKNPHGSKVNWMNYNTGIRNLYFRMEADENGARLCIDIQFHNLGLREVYYEQFLEFKDRLDKKFKDLQWLKEFDHSNGKQISRIVMSRGEANIFNKDDWDKMHLFLKLNFAKLDEFWEEFGEIFKNLK
jgi:hypothetical protein